MVRCSLYGSGGIGIFVHYRLLSVFNVDILDDSDECMLWLKLASKVSDFVLCLCMCYLPPKKSLHGNGGDVFYNTLLSQIYSYQNEGLICVCGDLNSRCGDLSDYIEGVDDIPRRECIDTEENEYGDLLIDFLVNTNMCMLNGRLSGKNDFTFIKTTGKSVVDFTLVPHEQLQFYSDFNVLTMTGAIRKHRLLPPDVLPDHSLLTWDLLLPQSDIDQMNMCQNMVDDGEINKQERFVIKSVPDDFLEGNLQRVQETIARIEQSIADEQGVNETYDEFVNLIVSEMKEKFPLCRNSVKKYKSKSMYKPYWNEELQEQWDSVEKCEELWKKCTSTTNRKRQLKAAFCQERKTFDTMNRKFKRKYQKEQQDALLNDFNQNTRDFWRKIGKLGIHQDRKIKIPWEIVDSDGQSDFDKRNVLNRWSCDFKNLFTGIGNDNFDENHLQHVKTSLQNDSWPENVPDTEQLNIDITLEEVQKAVYHAKLRKATGIDSIPAEVLKNPTCISLLHKLVNYCFHSGCVPAQWKQGIINPIPKGTGKDNRVPLNYRGITLISVPCKIYCDILNRRLVKWLEENQVIVDEQNGYRKKRSCEDHLYSLYSVINNRKLAKQSTYVCFVDAAKAFDNVNRDCLWYKLQMCGIRGKILGAIKSLYDGVKCAVRINDSLSPWFDVLCGVKQGCVISPTLFSIYINDLASEIKALNCGVKCDQIESSLFLFADDIALVAPTEDALQQMLNCLNSWCNKWRLNLNKDKTKIVHYRPVSSPESQYEFKCGDFIVEHVSKYKYLGLWLDQHLTMDIAASEIAKSASRALGVLISKFHATGGMDYKVFNALYDSLVQPILNYGAGIWGTKHHRLIKTVQHRASKFFIGVRDKTNNVAALGEMGWSSALSQQHMQVFRLWIRLKTKPDGGMCKEIHNWSLRRPGRTWEKNVKTLAEKYDVWGKLENFSGEHPKLMIKHVEQCVKEKDHMDWYYELWKDKNNVLNGNKLRTYRLHKERLEPEPYLLQNIPRYRYRVLSKLRCGTLPLAIETGRYQMPSIPLNERICKFCDHNVIESEIHFLIQCPFYDDLRYNVFNIMHNKTDFNVPAQSKYILLMTDTNIQVSLVNMCYNMFSRRKRHQLT